MGGFPIPRDGYTPQLNQTMKAGRGKQASLDARPQFQGTRQHGQSVYTMEILSLIRPAVINMLSLNTTPPLFTE